jgi:hypothetical protein
MSSKIRLEQLRVASPCPARWDQMDGDDRVRFCHQCQKHVYNLTVMSRSEVAQLIVQTEGTFCGRLYQRSDGTALPADCPVGLRRLGRAFVRRSARIAAAVLLVLFGWGYALARMQSDRRNPSVIEGRAPLETLRRWTFGHRPIVMGVMGPSSRDVRLMRQLRHAELNAAQQPPASE